MGCAGSEPFALRVLGDSMEPEFREGEIIVIEPGVPVEDGCFVVAEHNSEYIFRKLTKQQDRWYLMALNEQYPRLEIEGTHVIRGRIISKSNGRRRERKSYL